jgi:hypothetical protein
MKHLAPFFGKKVVRNAAIVLAIAVVAYVVMYGVREGFQAGREKEETLVPAQDGYYYVNFSDVAAGTSVIYKIGADNTPNKINRFVFEYWGPARRRGRRSFIPYRNAPDEKYQYQGDRIQTATFINRGQMKINNGSHRLRNVTTIKNPDNVTGVSINKSLGLNIQNLTPTNMNITNAGELPQTGPKGHIRFKIE